MNKTGRPRYAIPSAFLSVAGICVWCWLLFQAGCAGDAETGSRGDPLRAMALERTAAPFLLAGIAAGLLFISSLKHLEFKKRFLWAVRLILFGLPIAWSIGIQLELLALRICF
jgi:hypothetical protein